MENLESTESEKSEESEEFQWKLFDWVFNYIHLYYPPTVKVLRVGMTEFEEQGLIIIEVKTTLEPLEPINLDPPAHPRLREYRPAGYNIFENITFLDYNTVKRLVLTNKTPAVDLYNVTTRDDNNWLPRQAANPLIEFTQAQAQIQPDTMPQNQAEFVAREKGKERANQVVYEGVSPQWYCSEDLEYYSSPEYSPTSSPLHSPPAIVYNQNEATSSNQNREGSPPVIYRRTTLGFRKLRTGFPVLENPPVLSPPLYSPPPLDSPVGTSFFGSRFPSGNPEMLGHYATQYYLQNEPLRERIDSNILLLRRPSSYRSTGYVYPRNIIQGNPGVILPIPNVNLGQEFLSLCPIEHPVNSYLAPANFNTPVQNMVNAIPFFMNLGPTAAYHRVALPQPLPHIAPRIIVQPNIFPLL